MKTIYRLVLMMFTVVVLLMPSMPVQASKMDNRIESSAKNSYVFKTYLNADDINIHSMNGVVDLTGTVSEKSHKLLAEMTVTEFSMVKSVNNKLEVKGNRPAKNSDAWVITRVKTMLLFHRRMKGLDAEINVKDGIVTLQGKAANVAQKNLTTEYVKDVKGVKGVNNEMTVAETKKKTQSVGEKIDDASITAQVEMTLLYHLSTRDINTTVTTKNGLVTLTGTAENAKEKDVVAKIANDVKGVKGVNNQMTIGNLRLKSMKINPYWGDDEDEL